MARENQSDREELDTAASLLRFLPEEEVGAHRYDMLHELAPSPDPFMGVHITVPLARIRDHAANRGASITHALNKLVAVGLERTPEFNQVVLNARLFQVLGVHVTNVLLLPGEEQALTTIVLRDVQSKSLEQIGEEFRTLKAARIEQYQEGRLHGDKASRLAARSRLFRLRSKDVSFLEGMRKGKLSNVILSNLYFGAPTSFRTVKPIQFPRKIGMRIHVHYERQPAIEDGAIVEREALTFFVVADHRTTHAVHFQRLGETLQSIAEDPAEHLD